METQVAFRCFSGGNQRDYEIENISNKKEFAYIAPITYCRQRKDIGYYLLPDDDGDGEEEVIIISGSFNMAFGPSFS